MMLSTSISFKSAMLIAIAEELSLFNGYYLRPSFACVVQIVVSLSTQFPADNSKTTYRTRYIQVISEE